MIIFDSNVLKFGGFWLGFDSSPTPPQPTIYHVNVPTVQHGTVAVNPTEGPTGTLVTISTTPDTGYELDTISLTGAELINGNQFYIDGSDVTVNVTFTESTPVDPYNPLGLPGYTIRVQIADGETVTPMYDAQGYLPTVQQVSSSPNVWDLTYAKPNWQYAFGNNGTALAWCFRLSNSNSLKKVLGFNSTGITNMHCLFQSHSSLNEVCLFDTRSVTDAAYMFDECSSLQVLPNFNFAAVTTLRDVCDGCTALTYVPDWNVPVVADVTSAWGNTWKAEYGMLSFYNKVKDRISNYNQYKLCFGLCGKDRNSNYASEQARIERAQIPGLWGGDMS